MLEIQAIEDFPEDNTRQPREKTVAVPELRVVERNF
jgi:hypothetical protein